MYEKYHEIFKKSGLANGIDMTEFDSMLTQINPTIESYTKNTVIWDENIEVNSCGLVLEGYACSILYKLNGDRSIIELFHVGQLFGNILLFSQLENKSPSTIIAKTDCKILFIDSAYLIGGETVPHVSNSKLLYNFISNICNRAAKLYDNLALFRTKDIRGKISAFLYEYVKLEQKNSFKIPLNRSEMADYFFIPRPSLSRELGKMRDDGLIDFYKSEFTVLDVDELKKNM